MPNPTVSVTVTTNNAGQQAVTCTPATVQVPLSNGQGNVRIVFQVDTAGWVFPARAPSGDDMHGISIAGNTGGEFSSPSRSGDGRTVTILDKDDNATVYTYTVQIYNPATDSYLGVDPQIKNQ